MHKCKDEKTAHAKKRKRKLQPGLSNKNRTKEGREKIAAYRSSLRHYLVTRDITGNNKGKKEGVYEHQSSEHHQRKIEHSIKDRISYERDLILWKAADRKK